MAFQFASLGTGSSGNCFYVSGAGTAILIDAGLSFPATIQRMKMLGLSPASVSAIFVSHEHQDHTRGLATLANELRTPVYVTEATRLAGLRLIRHLAVPFSGWQQITIGQLTVTAVPVCHDAAEPHAFLVQHNDVVLGVFTDIGHACENVKLAFARCHAAVLEFNHDKQMLANGHYSHRLKQRISGALGHLSNDDAAALVHHQGGPHLRQVFAAHISAHNNNLEALQHSIAALDANISFNILPASLPSAVFTL